MDKLKNFFGGEGLYFTFTIIADILTILAFATAVSNVSFKGTLILFGITYLGTFLEQRKSYIKEGKELNAFLASAGCVISIVLLALCTIFDMGVANIDIQSGNIPQIILSSGEDTYFRWRSINITYYVFIGLLYPFLIHVLIVIVDFLKRENIGVVSMCKYIRGHWLKIGLIILFGSACGYILCGVKYKFLIYFGNNPDDRMGSPQYIKYMVAGSFGAFLYAIWYYARKNYHMQKNATTEETITTEQANYKELVKAEETENKTKMNEVLCKIQKEIWDKPIEGIKLLLGCAGVGAFWTNAIWYVFQLGYFSQLKIDKCYITIDGMISIYNIIVHLIVGLTLVCVNVIAICLKKMNERKIMAVMGLLEIGFIFYYVSAINHISLEDLIIDAVQNRNVVGVFSLICSLVMCVFIINLFSFSYWITDFLEKRLKRKSEVENSDYKEEQSHNESASIAQKTRGVICACVCVCVIFISGVFTFLLGNDSAYNKKDYRIIVSSQLKNMDLNVGSEIYAVLFQTEDEYIIAEINMEKDEPEIYYDKQMIIPKSGIETIYYENYKEINID